MPYTTSAKNEMLDALGNVAALAEPITHASLHTGYPGPTGANEVSGGSYTREAIAFSAAAAGVMSKDGTTVEFDVPASNNVSWVGLWDAVSGGNLKSWSPMGADAFVFCQDDAADTIEIVGGSLTLSEDDPITFYNGQTPSTSITEGDIYFAVNISGDTFQVAATAGGGAIDLDQQAASTCRCSPIVEESFGSAGTLELTSVDLDLNL